MVSFLFFSYIGLLKVVCCLFQNLFIGNTSNENELDLHKYFFTKNVRLTKLRTFFVRLSLLLPVVKAKHKNEYETE